MTRHHFFPMCLPFVNTVYNSILFSLAFRAVFCNKVFYTSWRLLGNTEYMLVINSGGLQICRYRCNVLLTHYCVTALNGPLKIFLAKVIYPKIARYCHAASRDLFPGILACQIPGKRGFC